MSKGQIAFAALHHRDYRRYFIVNLLSSMGDNIEHVISYWLLFQKFRSPVLGGFAVISHWTPSLFFCGLFRRACRPSRLPGCFKPAQLMHASVSLAWGILFLTDTIQVWHACVLLVIHGMAGVLGGPGSQLIIHDIVGREYLQSAVQLNSTARQLAVFSSVRRSGEQPCCFLARRWGFSLISLMFTPMFILMFILPYTGHGRDEGMKRQGAAA